jgi:hypothetical protein
MCQGSVHVLNENYLSTMIQGVDHGLELTQFLAQPANLAPGMRDATLSIGHMCFWFTLLQVSLSRAHAPSPTEAPAVTARCPARRKQPRMWREFSHDASPAKLAGMLWVHRTCSRCCKNSGLTTVKTLGLGSRTTLNIVRLDQCVTMGG